MADKRKAKAQEDAHRIAEWLVQNRTEFEQAGIGLAKLTESVGLPETDVRLALDHLENHEEIVRWPQALLKPGRIWPQTRDAVLAKSSSQ
jgi:predicted transcriptional regulator